MPSGGVYDIRTPLLRSYLPAGAVDCLLDCGAVEMRHYPKWATDLGATLDITPRQVTRMGRVEAYRLFRMAPEARDAMLSIIRKARKTDGQQKSPSGGGA